MTALTVGLIAYQGPHTTITVLGVNEATGQLIGLGLLLVSALAGLARMESKVLLLQLNAKVLDARVGCVARAASRPARAGCENRVFTAGVRSSGVAKRIALCEWRARRGSSA